MLNLKRFTIVELLVVISIVIILISLLMPAFNGAKNTAKQISCTNQLKTLGLGVLYYAQDNNDWFPGFINTTSGIQWDYQIENYVQCPYITSKSATIFHCPGQKLQTLIPGDNPWRSRGYGYNFYPGPYQNNPGRLFTCKSPSSLALICDFEYYDGTSIEGLRHAGGSNPNYIAINSSWSVYISYPHFNKSNVLFTDGHVKACAKGILDNKGNPIPAKTQWNNDGEIW